MKFAHFRIYLSAAAESGKRGRFLLQLQDPAVIVQCLHVMFRIPVGRGAEQVGRAASRSGMDGLGSAGNGLLIILAVVMKGGLRQESLNRIDFGVAGIELGGLLKILPGFFLFAHVDPCAAAAAISGGHIREKPNQLVEIFHGSVALTLAQEKVCPRFEGRGALGIEADRFIQIQAGPLRIGLLQADRRAHEVEHGHAVTKPLGLVEILDRPGEFLLLKMGDAPVVMRDGIRRFQVEGLVEVVQALAGSPRRPWRLPRTAYGTLQADADSMAAEASSTAASSEPICICTFARRTSPPACLGDNLSVASQAAKASSSSFSPRCASARVSCTSQPSIPKRRASVQSAMALRRAPRRRWTWPRMA